MGSGSVIEPAISTPSQTWRAGARCLLVVDDDESVRGSLSIVFRDLYNLLVAEDGMQALELVARHPVDAVVLDIRMPGLSGIEVLGRLKRINPAIEVIIVTGYETIETARQALRLGACDYLSKPYDVSTVREAVVTAMERRAISEQIGEYNKKLADLQSEIHDQRLREEFARTRTEIYASVIHDINNPLTVISGFIEVINERLSKVAKIEGEDLTVLKEELQAVLRHVTSCIEISRRYLSFLKARTPSEASLRANQVLADLKDLLRAHPSAARNKLTFRPLREDVEVRMNGTDLLQILLNLTINALQAVPIPHHVHVEAAILRNVDLSHAAAHPQTDRAFHPRVLPAGRVLLLSVQDDGPGIPPELLDKIFEPYYTTKPQGQGTGLGLVIVRRLVDQAGGILHLHTEVGRGANFSVFIPLAET